MKELKVDSKTGVVELETAHGTLILQPFNDCDYPGFDIDFKLKGHEDEPAVPIAMVEDASPAVTPGDAVVVRIYGNVNDDEYTDRVDIPIKEIRDAYDELTATCPNCGRASTLMAWNRITKECYGDEFTGIVEISDEDFTDDGRLSGDPVDHLYKCPKCGKEDILGKDILKND